PVRGRVAAVLLVAARGPVRPRLRISLLASGMRRAGRRDRGVAVRSGPPVVPWTFAGLVAGRAGRAVRGAGVVAGGSALGRGRAVPVARTGISPLRRVPRTVRLRSRVGAGSIGSAAALVARTTDRTRTSLIAGVIGTVRVGRRAAVASQAAMTRP